MEQRNLIRSGDHRDYPTVAAVSVTRNRCEPLVRVLSQLRSLDYPGDKLGVFIVDSASADDTVARIRQQFPDVHLTESKENLGIAAGFNTGIRQALKAQRQYKYIWLLDSDVEIEDGTLMPLVDTAEQNSEIGVVGSAVYEPQDRETLVTAGLNIDWSSANVAVHIPADEKAAGLYDVAVIPACSSLTRADLYDKLGLWDERLWLYWGDTEWCTRIRRNGYRVCCDGRSKVWHRNWANIQPNFSFPYVLHDRVRSALVFNNCHNPKRSIACMQRFILRCYLKAAFENFTARPNFSRAYDEGVQDFLCGDTSKRDFSSWLDTANLPKTDDAIKSLTDKISKRPTIILNQISDESIKEKVIIAFEKHFEQIQWKSISPEKEVQGRSASERSRLYLSSYLPKLLMKIMTYYCRKDVIVSSISDPCLYNTVSAQHTLFYDDQLHSYVQENNLLKSLVACVRMLMKGISVAFFSLPKALKECEPLKKGPIGVIERQD